MPSLKQLTCSIELGPGNTPLKEYGARYYDGAVETLIAVPETAIPFSIHVASEGYIAPGLAVYVFIDGVYQCNRNKSIGDSVGDRGDPTGCNAEFRLRQKEEKLPDGSFLGRGWSFAKLDVVRANSASAGGKNFQRNVGTIEVVVLRCAYDNGVAAAAEQPGYSDHVCVSPSGRVAAQAPSIRASSVRAASGAAGEGSSGGMLGGMFGLFDGACEYRQYGLDGAEEWGAATAGGGGGGDFGQPVPRQWPRQSNPAGAAGFGQPGWQYSNPYVRGPVNAQAVLFSPENVLNAQVLQLRQMREKLGERGIDAEVIAKALADDEAMRNMDFHLLTTDDVAYLRELTRREKNKWKDKTSDKLHRSERRRTGDKVEGWAADDEDWGKKTSGWKEDKQEKEGFWSADSESKKRSSKSITSKRGSSKSSTTVSHHLRSQHDERGAGEKMKDNDVWGTAGDQNQQKDNGWANTEQNGAWEKEKSSNKTASQSSQTHGWGNDGQNSRASSKVASMTNGGASWAARSIDPKGFIKPYWADWNKPSGTGDGTEARGRMAPKPREVYTYPAAPPPAIASNQKVEADHGVRAGRGALYMHKTRRPVYLDSMTAPYAVFSFKYRSRKKIEEMTGRKIKKDLERVVEVAEKDRFMRMPKEKLVERLMQTQLGRGKKTEDGGDVGPEELASQSGSRAQAGGEWIAANGEKQDNNHNGGWGNSDSKAGSKRGGAGFQPDWQQKGAGVTGGTIRW